MPSPFSIGSPYNIYDAPDTPSTPGTATPGTPLRPDGRPSKGRKHFKPSGDGGTPGDKSVPSPYSIGSPYNIYDAPDTPSTSGIISPGTPLGPDGRPSKGRKHFTPLGDGGTPGGAANHSSAATGGDDGGNGGGGGEDSGEEKLPEPAMRPKAASMTDVSGRSEP